MRFGAILRGAITCLLLDLLNLLNIMMVLNVLRGGEDGKSMCIQFVACSSLRTLFSFLFFPDSPSSPLPKHYSNLCVTTKSMMCVLHTT